MYKLLARDYDEFTGITEETWYDETAGTVTLRRLQDVEHTLAMNKVKRNETGKGFRDVKGGAYHKARIPFMVVEKWLREEGFDWFNSSTKEKRAKLNDPDNADLLVREGRV
jgi:hypothetical protein